MIFCFIEKKYKLFVMINDKNIYDEIKIILEKNNIDNEKLYNELILVYDDYMYNNKLNDNIIKDMDIKTFMITENNILKCLFLLSLY